MMADIDPAGTITPLADSGYVSAFYDIAEMLGIGARAASPADVWEAEMRPKLTRLLKQAEAGAKESPTIAGGMKAVRLMTEREINQFTERMADRDPNKMETCLRRWDAYRLVVPRVVCALGLFYEPSKAERIASVTGIDKGAVATVLALAGST